MKRHLLMIFLIGWVTFSLGGCSDSEGINFKINPEDTFGGDDAEPVSNLTIEGDKISCEFCDGFGTFIEAFENQIFVGGRKKVWVFERTGQTTVLSQEINLNESVELNSLSLVDNFLLLGLIDNNGTGSVNRYVKNTNGWEFESQYEIGRRGDNFGNDISFSNRFIVIGASAVWSNVGIDNAGSFYIYSRESVDWNLIDEFAAVNGFGDDRFGSDVIVWEDYILAGGISIPLHIFHFENETWSLFNVEEDILTTDMAHHEGTILYYSEEFGFQSFVINAEGSLEPLSIDASLVSNGGIRFSSDNISMIEDFALITDLGGQELYLLKLMENEWALEKTFAPANEPQFEYLGVKLTKEFALIGGNNSSNSSSYLFFEKY